MANPLGRDIARSRARQLRRAMTDVERAMWGVLRDRRLVALKWRRQVPIGRYIVDFLCFEHRLIVECDGSQHADSSYDLERDKWLKSQGFEVLRFWNIDVVRTRGAVIDAILLTCELWE